MRVAHWGIWAPNKSGMFHTTDDLCRGEQELGIDAAIIDALSPEAKTTGRYSCVGHEYADAADIYCLHLTIPQPYYSDGTPTVVVLHGNPLYSMQLELYHLEPDNPSPFSTVLELFKRSTPTWYVSFWEEEQGAYWDALDGVRDKPRIRYLPRGIVFGDQWTPEGDKAQLEGDPVIVIADQFRLFKDALPVLWGAYHYWLRNPRARIYLYALPPAGSQTRTTLDRWIQHGQIHRCIGGMSDIVDYLPSVFRRADVLVSTVTGESRVALEAQGCGTAVVAPWPGADVELGRFWQPEEVATAIEQAVATGISAQARRERADRTRARYDIRPCVEGMKLLFEEIMDHGATGG